MIPDFINSLFMSAGALLSLLNIRQLYHDKALKGISVYPTLLYIAWGLWDFYYFPHLNQWFSLSSSILCVLINGYWLGMVFYYKKVYHEL